MTNKRIKNIIIAFISLLSIAVIMTVSFAAWDVKSGSNQFAANAGKRVQVSIVNPGTFNKKLYPDGFQPVDASKTLVPNDDSALFIYSEFTANYLDNDGKVTTDASYIKNTKLRWKYSELTINGKSILNTDKTAILSTSVFDAWVASSATYEKPSGSYLIEPSNGEIQKGNTYYFVIRFKTSYVKSFKDASNTTYYFYSDETYTTSSSATKMAINKANLGLTGLPFVGGVYNYACAPYTEEKIDTSSVSSYVGQKISAKLVIYADGGTIA